VARARMLSKKISTDSRVAQLSGPLARLLFTWMIPHADSLGRLRGEPAYLRTLVIPHEPHVTDQDVATWLAEMNAFGLVQTYEVDGGSYVVFPAWSRHQRLDRMKYSDLPDPPLRTPLVTNGGPSAARSGREGESEVEVESEEEREGKRRGTGKRNPTTSDREEPDPLSQVDRLCRDMSVTHSERTALFQRHGGNAAKMLAELRGEPQ